jgi:hypothetical protein
MLIIKGYRSFKTITLLQCNKKTEINLFSEKLYSFQKLIFLLLSALFVITGCSPTRRLQEGDYLLARIEIHIDNKEIEKAEIKKYEKQTANRRILGLKFHLFIYNLASPKKTKFPSSWLREIGEAPKIWDPLLTAKTTEQFQKFLENKGYYEAHVNDTTIFKKNWAIAKKQAVKKRAIVKYSIILNEPVRINSINYQFEDKDIASVVLEDTLDRLINIGDRFDKEIIQKERLRIEERFKNLGYYKFLKEFIFLEAKETAEPKRVDLTFLIKDNVYGEIDPVTKIRKHRQYKIDKVYIYPNYIQPGKKTNDLTAKTDTVVNNDNHIIYYGDHFIKTDAVIAPNLSIPGSIYNLTNVKRTYSNYTSIGLFRIANIYFKDIEEPDIMDTSVYRYLNNYVELYPRKRHAFTYEVVGTISTRQNYGDNLGAKLNITYNNYNFFGGAEHLQFKLVGAIENLSLTTSTIKPTKIGGAETTITFPKFFAPFKADRFTRKFNPKTIISIIYNYQKRLEYTSTSANASFGYIWKGNSYNKNTLIPLDFIYVWLPAGIDEPTKELFQRTAMINKFYDHAILSTRYQFEFSDQVIEKLSDYVFLRINVETAGNAVKGIMDLTNWNDSLFGVEYYQFAKGDVELRYNHQLNRYNRVVYRLFAGLGYPYGNSSTLPFEKMYSSGDVNGIRAWSSYTLGPGSAVDTNYSYSYITHLGDIKLEGNLEYRFDLFWKLEGALFVDAGNIWTLNDYMNRPEAEFKINNFWDDIAIGSGIGIRFDLSFLLIRTDFGFKLRDPRITNGSKWIDANNTGTDELPSNFWKRWNFQFALGYPF